MMRPLAAVMAVLLFAFPVGALGLTGTQSLMVEYGAGEWAAMGTLVLNLELSPAWDVTYIHDRQWRGDVRAQVHDVSVSRYISRDRTLTAGWSARAPGGHTVYGILSWRRGIGL